MKNDDSGMTPFRLIRDSFQSILQLGILGVLLYGVRQIGAREAEFDALKMVVQERGNTIKEINAALAGLGVAVSNLSLSDTQKEKEMERFRAEFARIWNRLDRHTKTEPG